MTNQRPSLGIVCHLVHARRVPSEARELFAKRAAAVAADPRVILLSTCHRVEMYVAAAAAMDDVAPLPPMPALPAGGRWLAEEDAVRHLFNVAAGLDSVVLGEDQVLHQLRECLADRHLAALEETGGACVEGKRGALPTEIRGELVPVLDRLFQLALHVGRETRAWREGPPRSLADVALDRIEASAPLAGKTVLIAGAGQMSRIAALAAARRNARVVISNRTADRAARLAADVCGSTVPFGELPGHAAGVIVALGGRWPLSDAARAELAGAAALIVVDLSSPTAVDADACFALGDRFVSVDDIARAPAQSLRPKLRRRTERLIDEAVAELLRWNAARSGVPTIEALTEQAEARRQAEVERLLRRLPDLDDRERELVEQMSQRLVAGILHAPLASLRADDNGDREQAARELFAL